MPCTGAYTEHAGLEIPVNSRIASPFSRQIAIGNAGPILALESMGAKPTFRYNFFNIGLSYKQSDLDIKHINIALKAVNLDLKIQHFPGRVLSDTPLPTPSMSILITIALLLFFNEDSYRDHLSFYLLQSDGGGGALLECFPDFWVSDVNIIITPHYIG